MIYFSIIIPVKGRFKAKEFPKFCEVIYVNKFTKSVARNWGSKKAKGKYLIHIDIDNQIDDEVFPKIKKLIKSGATAIILEEYIKNPKSVWQKARQLERKIVAGNKILATPQIIEKKLFEKVGGYDERFNELDDWALWMRLRAVHSTLYTVHRATNVFEPTNIFQILKRRFKKGQELKYFKEVYGDIPQVSFKNTLNLYLKTPPSIYLLILKFFDYLGLLLGSLFPIRQNIDQIYKEKNVAKSFDDEQLSLYGKIKHNFEMQALFNQIQDSGFNILDLGAGTGRLTKELVKKGFKVTPADISQAMIDQMLQQSWISLCETKPILLKSDKLPFKNNFFDTVISMRVIWHIKDNKKREKFFSEAVRATKKYIIMDFSFFGNSDDHQFSWIEIKNLAKKSKLKILSHFYLPLGRLLIKFEKT